MITLLVHESCHYAACFLVGNHIEQVDLLPFGGIMTYKQGIIPHKGLKGVWVHAAGPIGNYIFLHCLGQPIVQQYLHPAFLRSLLLANSSMLFINLLPALPMDGGHIVFCLGYYLFPVFDLIRWLSRLGRCVGISGIMLAVYGLLLYNKLNCSVLIVSIHILFCIGKDHRNLLAENIYPIIHERLAQSVGIRRVEHYLVMHNEPLFNLIPSLKEGRSVSFFFSQEQQLFELTEYAFCRALLENPSSTVKEAYLKFTQ